MLLVASHSLAPPSSALTPSPHTLRSLPMAIGFMFLYAQLANVLTTQALFYTIIFPFIAFFGSFAFILYPLRDVLHPNDFCDWVLSVIGERFSAPVAILRNWTFCLFYVMAELWGSVVVSVLFWVRY
jgi:AAA family ATP:ADP antiporter